MATRDATGARHALLAGLIDHAALIAKQLRSHPATTQVPSGSHQQISIQTLQSLHQSDHTPQAQTITRHALHKPANIDYPWRFLLHSTP
jgi:hypothetical protein